MKTTLVGLGLIGGSLALDLKALGFATQVTGVDADPRHCEKALELGLVDSVASLEEATRSADLVILAVPVTPIAQLLPQVLDWIKDDATVTDMGSTKEALCRSVESHPKRAQYVPSHPMAGTENSGPTAALKGLFTGKTAVICDRARSAPWHLSRVESMYQALQMRIVHMSSSEHDLHAAYVSHLSHISSFVLANTVLTQEENVKTIFDLAGGGFESTVRLAKSSPDMWTPIFEQNSGNIKDALESYIAHLMVFHQALTEQDSGLLRSLMENANQIRRVLQSIGSQGKPR